MSALFDAPAIPRHPARFTPAIVATLVDVLSDAAYDILDPFAGVGGIHALRHWGHVTTGVELEPEWAAASPHTEVGDATRLRFGDASFDAVVTSPAYGNRMADHHEARDDSRRNTYRHALGRPLSDGNAGAMQWGAAYRRLHASAWIEAVRVVRPGGLVVVNVSNHIRAGVEQLVAEWHAETLIRLGCRIHEMRRVSTPRNGFGANGDVRVDGELVMAFRTPEAPA